MSFLTEMKLVGLIDLCFILILISKSEGQGWNITVQRRFRASSGSDVTIPCMFTCPKKQRTKDVLVYWKKGVRSTFNTHDNDQNAFVSHTNDSFVIEKYRGHTELIGDKANGNCTLSIRNIKENEQGIYVRVIAKADNYSFTAYYVTITLSDVTVTLNPDFVITNVPTDEPTTKGAMQQTSTPMYIGIFLPLAALLIIICITGVVFYIRRKKSKSFNREGSGHFASFRGPNREKLSSKNNDVKKFPEQKATDEPVYVNFEVPLGQMDQRMDNTDNVYANVDYS